MHIACTYTIGRYMVYVLAYNYGHAYEGEILQIPHSPEHNIRQLSMRAKYSAYYIRLEDKEKWPRVPILYRRTFPSTAVMREKILRTND